ncbi:MAG: oligosaccharide flippase family protein [Planctomycetales bacterium]|nr:oligosaccharide flippase family protein [Planctomycetales bacterium]
MKTTESTAEESTLSGEVRNVGRHSVIYMLAPAISKVIGFLLFPLYTSFISTSNYGVSSLIEIAMTFAMLVMSVNLADGMTRFYYATDDEGERRKVVVSVIAGIAGIGIPAVLVFILCSGAIANFMRLEVAFVPLLRIAFAAAWFSMLAEIGYAYLRMRYKSKTFVALTVAQILLFIALNVVFVVFLQLDIWGIFFSTLIVQGLLGVGMAVGILSALKVSPDWKLFGRMVRFGAPLMPATVSQQLNNYVHPMMLQWLSVADPAVAATHVGVFAAGQKIGVVVNRFVVVPFNGFWRPRRMELVMRQSESVNRILARMCTYSFVLTAAFALLLSVAAKSTLLLMNEYGLVSDEAYLDAHLVVPLIALAYTIHSLEPHFATGMHASGRTKQATAIGLVALAATIATNWLLIPKLGFVAAAIATNVGVVIRAGAFLAVSQRKLRIPYELSRLAIAIVVAVGLFLTIRTVEFDSTWATLLGGIAMSTLYAPLLLCCGFLDKDERLKLATTVRATLARFRAARQATG